MGWLRELTDWLVQQIVTVWDAFVSFMGEWLLWLAEMIFELGAVVIESIPVPDFVTQYTIGGMLGNIGPDLAWVIGPLRLGEGMLILAAGYGFRLLRKALTLGQW